MGVRFCGYVMGLLFGVEVGIGTCCGLVLRVFCRLASLGGAGVGSLLLLCARAQYLVVAILMRVERFSTNEKGLDLERDGEVVKEEVLGWELSSGWSTGRVFLTRDIVHVHCPTTALQQGEDTTENPVGGFVGA